MYNPVQRGTAIVRKTQVRPGTARNVGENSTNIEEEKLRKNMKQVEKSWKRVGTSLGVILGHLALGGHHMRSLGSHFGSQGPRGPGSDEKVKV